MTDVFMLRFIMISTMLLFIMAVLLYRVWKTSSGVSKRFGSAFGDLGYSDVFREQAERYREELTGTLQEQFPQYTVLPGNYNPLWEIFTVLILDVENEERKKEVALIADDILNRTLKRAHFSGYALVYTAEESTPFHHAPETEAYFLMTGRGKEKSW
jgi:hypothetical protein